MNAIPAALSGEMKRTQPAIPYPHSPSSHPAYPSPEISPDKGHLQLVEKMQSVEIHQSGSTSMEIFTNDGDRITINMTSEWGASMSHYQSASALHYREQATLGQYEGYSIQYQVEGELDEEETEALDALMSSVSVAVNDFFNGDLANAISNLERFELDKKEFTSLSLSMERSSTVAMTQAYREVSQMGSGGPHASPAPTNLIGLSAFVQDVQKMVDDVSEYLQRILMPGEFVNGLIGQAIERDPRSHTMEGGLLAEVYEYLDQMTASTPYTVTEEAS